jgi:hypothetical protein
MSTFIPPTRSDPIGPESVNHSERFSLWRHYGTSIPVSYSVIITSGAATAAPGRVSPSADDIAGADTGSGEGGLAWFRGGQTYTITSAEETILTSAGYGAYIT